MRIISKFHDYYDSVQSHGQDKNRLFERKQEYFYIPYDTLSIPFLKFINHFNDFNIIGFAGKIYIYHYSYGHTYNAEARKCIKSNYQVHTQWQEIQELIENNDTLNKKYQRLPILNDKSFNEAGFNAVHNDKRLLKLFEKYNTPVFQLHLKYDTWELIINPCLKDIGFFKIKDTFTAFQEIDQYLGTVLVKEQQGHIPTGDDVVLAQSKGFDRYSFRKDKSKKR